MEAKVTFAKSVLGISYDLKDKQLETLRNVYEHRDCISVLPTGYGKSIMYQLLPWFLSQSGQAGIVIVICPLTAIMQDQVMSLVKRGVKATFLNVDGSRGYSFTDIDDDSTNDEEEELMDFEITTTDMGELERGAYNLIYAHPEALFSRRISKMLRTDVYQKAVSCIAVDEVHMITEWGEEFRTSFQRLGEIVNLFPDAAHLAVTATATPQAIEKLSTVLQFHKPSVVKVNPDRPNIFLEIKPRSPNIRKYDKYDEFIKPLAHELREDLLNFRVTIVYVESLEALGYFFKFLEFTLKDLQFTGEHIAQNRIFAQFHKDYSPSMKEHIIRELGKEKPILRLVLATVALGMGLNAPSVQRIIHCRPPTSIENYFQEVGRAGRRGQESCATMFYNNSDISASRKGITSEMIAFCKTSSCLRMFVMEHFGFSNVQFQGPKHQCCSNCRLLH